MLGERTSNRAGQRHPIGLVRIFNGRAVHRDTERLAHVKDAIQKTPFQALLFAIGGNDERRRQLFYDDRISQLSTLLIRPILPDPFFATSSSS